MVLISSNNLLGAVFTRCIMSITNPSVSVDSQVVKSAATYTSSKKGVQMSYYVLYISTNKIVNNDTR